MFASLQRCAYLLAQYIATRDFSSGKVLHSYLIKTSLISNVFISNRLVEFYSKCNSIESAQKAFDDLPYRNNHSWNILVSGYSKNGRFDQAHQLLEKMPERDIVSYNSVISGLGHYGLYKESVYFFKKMQRLYTGLFLDEYTIVNVVSNCALLGAVQLLHQIHGMVILLGLQFDVVVCNILIDAYGKCGLPDLSY
uniref:Uncharacterized protein n=2 Tax=Opuntia streptacantha TaxID=393608 RepID=A0A7C9D7A5_OPUST